VASHEVRKPSVACGADDRALRASDIGDHAASESGCVRSKKLDDHVDRRCQDDQVSAVDSLDRIVAIERDDARARIGAAGGERD